MIRFVVKYNEHRATRSQCNHLELTGRFKKSCELAKVLSLTLWHLRWQNGELSGDVKMNDTSFRATESKGKPGKIYFVWGILFGKEDELDIHWAIWCTSTCSRPWWCLKSRLSWHVTNTYKHTQIFPVTRQQRTQLFLRGGVAEAKKKLKIFWMLACWRMLSPMYHGYVLR